ncbi:hypothetical protein D3C72_788580 [compost metagenome]
MCCRATFPRSRHAGWPGCLGGCRRAVAPVRRGTGLASNWLGWPMQHFAHEFAGERPRPDRRWFSLADAGVELAALVDTRFANLPAAIARTRRPPPGDAPPATGAGPPRPCPPARRATAGRPADSGWLARRCTVQAVHRHWRPGAATAPRRCSTARPGPVARRRRPDATADATRRDVLPARPRPVAGCRCPAARAVPAAATGSSGDGPRCLARRTSAGSASAAPRHAPAPGR